MKIKFNENSFKELKGQCCHSSVFPTMCVALLQFIQEIISVGIRMRIGLQYPSLVVKYLVLNLANRRMWQQKLTPRTCHSRCGTIKTPLGCSGDTNAVSSQSSSYEWNTFECDLKQYSVNQFKGKLSFCERREVSWRALPRTMTLDNVFWRALPRTMTLDMFGVETAFWSLALFFFTQILRNF